jgi:hypothetical protein
VEVIFELKWRLPKLILGSLIQISFNFGSNLIELGILSNRHLVQEIACLIFFFGHSEIFFCGCGDEAVTIDLCKKDFF